MRQWCGRPEVRPAGARGGPEVQSAEPSRRDLLAGRLERFQDVLGHSPPTVTKSIYVEATRRVQQDAVDRLGFLFDA